MKAHYLTLAAVLMWTFSPHAALAQANVSDEKPFVFEIKDSQNQTSAPATAGLPTLEELISQTLKQIADVTELEQIAPVDPRTAVMRQYLESKKSPLAPFAEEVLQNYHYRLILGISFAESNFCKRNIRPHNCWGIGGGKPEQYRDYAHAFSRADQLIQKYHDGGLTTPKLMRNRWVGWKNDKWILAVEQVTRDLKSRGL